jgi:hypothetical protein
MKVALLWLTGNDYGSRLAACPDYTRTVILIGRIHLGFLQALINQRAKLPLLLMITEERDASCSQNALMTPLRSIRPSP